jgi:hypothetical protein
VLGGKKMGDGEGPAHPRATVALAWIVTVYHMVRYLSREGRRLLAILGPSCGDEYIPAIQFGP